MLKRLIIQILFSLGLLISLGSAKAVVLDALYSDVVTIRSKSSETRQTAIEQALEAVLLKLTANPQLINQLRPRLKRIAPELLNNYSYLSSSHHEASQEHWRLRVQFDARAVNRFLQAEAIPLWGNKRPLLMTWLAIEQEGQRRIINITDDEPIQTMAATLEQQFNRYGVPVVFPLLDLTDQNEVNLTDVWGLFKQPLQRGAARYGADAVLAGRILQRADGRWTAEWLLTATAKQQQWQAQDYSLETLLATVSQKVASELLSTYALSAEAGERLSVNINAIDSINDYARVISYFAQQDAISDVQVQQVDGQQLSLSLWIQGGRQALLQGVRLDKLFSVADETLTPDAPLLLNYHP